MHHALLIPDVRAYIFAAIKEDKQTSRATFATLASTCKLLSDASLDALWSELHSLHPLASCIYMANTIPLSNELTTDVYDDTKPDLSVFHKYAHRVRKLDASTQHSMRALRAGNRYLDFVDDLGALLYYRIPSPLLPNLRHLTWASATSINLLRHLLSPHLLSLKIPNNHWVAESSPFCLTKIPELCPKIKSLTLQIQGGDPSGHAHVRELAQSYMSQVICSWRDLEELDCNVMTTRGVLQLSALSSLKILRLQINSSAVADLSSNSLSFPSLHTLQLKTDAIESVSAFITAMKNLPKSLKIDACPPHYRRGGCSREVVELLLRLIADASHCDLRNFGLNLPPLGDDHVNVADMLRPLFSCCELRTLYVRMLSQFTLGDDNLRMMATAWPQLEELELIDHRRTRTIVYPPPIPQPPVAPAPAAGPEVIPPAPVQPQTLITTMDPGPLTQPLQPPTPPQVAGPVQMPQPENPPIPVVYFHMDAQPLQAPAANPGQMHHQLLPTFPHPIPAGIQITHAGHSPFLRTADITFHGLIWLLELCPNIRYFDLAIDTTRLEGLEGNNPGGGVCNRLIREARLIDSPINDASVVARILLNILPQLDDVVGSAFPRPIYPHHHMMPQRWLQVRQIIRDSRTQFP